MAEAQRITVSDNIQPGNRFGRLTVLVSLTRTRGGPKMECRCDCGRVIFVYAKFLRSGHTKSCGCLRRDTVARLTFSHGLASSPEYKVWRGMISRCTNPRATGYHRWYGGRGVDVCEEWAKSFTAFMADMGRRPSDKHTIERRENSKGYCKDNCYWATKTEQGRNTRANRVLTDGGTTRCLAEWSEVTGIGSNTISARIDRLGWSVHDALTIPVRLSKQSGLT
jgi:hypothetical protein